MRCPTMRDPRTAARICAFHIAWLDFPSFSVMAIPISGLRIAVLIMAAVEEPMEAIYFVALNTMKDIRGAEVCRWERRASSWPVATC